MSKPFVSVVTVVYNDISSIEKTLNSVINQGYTNFEYIVIDGASCDGTFELLSEYKSSITTLISEDDNGIYDAMNKGIGLCQGEWIIFMNSGDSFYSDSVLESLFSSDLSKFDLVVGGAVANSDWGTISLPVRDSGNIWKSFTHQAVFVRVDIGPDILFQEGFKCAADYDLIYRLLMSGVKPFIYANPVCYVTFSEAGHSAKFSLRSKYEVIVSILRNFSFRHSWYHLGYHVFKFFVNCVSVFLSRFFPNVLKKLRSARDSGSFV